MAPSDDIEQYLDEEFLKRLEKLQVLSQKGMKGMAKGEHQSWRSGASLEFLDYRKYQLGDDFRYIDWNVLGRLDKLFIKLFHAEEDLTIHILMDMSRSMSLGRPSKSMYAKKAAAALSYIGLAGLDRVGVTAFSDSLRESLSPRKGKQYYWMILKYMNMLRPAGQTDFNSCLIDYSTKCKRPGPALIISDLWDPKGFKPGLEALLHRGFEPALIQVLTPDELDPQIDGYLELSDIEFEETKKVAFDTELKTGYRERVGRFIDEINEFCLQNGIGYYLCDTGAPFEEFLLDCLLKGKIFH